jgi:hypothetical protein
VLLKLAMVKDKELASIAYCTPLAWLQFFDAYTALAVQKGPPAGAEVLLEENGHFSDTWVLLALNIWTQFLIWLNGRFLANPRNASRSKRSVDQGSAARIRQ